MNRRVVSPPPDAPASRHEVAQLGDVATVLVGLHVSREIAKATSPQRTLTPQRVIEIADVQDDRIVAPDRISKRELPSPIDARFRACHDDLLVSCRGTVFKTVLVGAAHEGVLVSAGFVIVRPGPTVRGGYLLALARSSLWREILLAHSHSSTGLLQWTGPDFRRLPVPLVPSETQRQIAAVVEREGAWRLACEESMRLRDEYVRAVIAEALNLADIHARPKGGTA